MADTLTDRNTVPESAVGEAATYWWVFLAIGILMVVFGFIAMGNILTATVVTVYYIAIMMVVAGLAQMVGAFRSSGVGRTLFWLLAGALYLVAGIFAFANPLMASAVLTLMLAVTLIVSGIARMVAGFGTRPMSAWLFFVLGGLVTLIAGVLIALGWPGTLWILGVILAVDFIVQGTAYAVFAFALRKWTKGETKV